MILILIYLGTLALVAGWFLMTIVGIGYSAYNLTDAWKRLQWQKASGINGAWHLLAAGHLRTAILRTVELVYILLIALVTSFHLPIGNWFNVVGVFVIVGGLSVASRMDYIDRHKLSVGDEKG